MPAVHAPARPSVLRRRPRPVVLVLWVAVLAPSLVYWLRLPDFGRLPSNDYYGVVRDVSDADGSIDTRPGTWIGLRSNEHRVALPAAIYLLNVAATDGDNRGLAVWVLLVLTLSLVLLLRLLPLSARGRPEAFVGLGLLVSILVFNPVQAHNVLRAFSGTMWMSANLLAIVALWSLARAAATGRRRYLAGAIAAALAAGFTYSSHLSLWPALLVAGAVLGLGRRRLGAIAIATAVVYAMAWTTYPDLPHSPEFAGASALDEVRFALVYLGSIFSRDTAVAAGFGLAGLAAALVFWARALPSLLGRRSAGAAARRRRRQLAPWLGLTLYAAGNAAGTAIGRAAGGLEGALASRYANLAALFWIGVLVPLALDAFVRRPKTGRAAATAAAARPGRQVFAALLLAALAIAVAGRGLPVYQRIFDGFARQPVTALALAWEVEDEVSARYVTLRPDGLWQALPFLRAQEHVPFDEPPPIPWLGEPLPAEVRGDRGVGIRGFLERVEPVGGRVVRVQGWVGGEAGRVERILLTDGDGVVRGAAWPISPRRLPAGPRTPAEASDWMGYARRPRGTGRLIAWAEPAGGRRLVPLPRVWGAPPGGPRAGDGPGTDRAPGIPAAPGPP